MNQLFSFNNSVAFNALQGFANQLFAIAAKRWRGEGPEEIYERKQSLRHLLVAIKTIDQDLAPELSMHDRKCYHLA